MTRLMPLLLLCACASSTFERGAAPVTPVQPSRPTYTPNGTGLPSPRPGVAPLPRSPNRRQLPPPCNHPGLWSADRPKASQGRVTEHAVAGIKLPIPDVGEELQPFADHWANKCAQVGSIFMEGERASKLGRLSEIDQACFVASIYASCGASLKKANAAAREKFSAAELQAIEALHVFATRTQKTLCDKTDEPGKIAILLRDVVDEMFDVIQEVRRGYLN